MRTRRVITGSIFIKNVWSDRPPIIHFDACVILYWKNKNKNMLTKTKQ
jgi:hypothetical protein